MFRAVLISVHVVICYTSIVRPSERSVATRLESRWKSVFFYSIATLSLFIHYDLTFSLGFWKNVISRSERAHLHLLSGIMHAQSLLCFKMQMRVVSRSHILSLNAHSHWAEVDWRSPLRWVLIYLLGGDGVLWWLGFGFILYVLCHLK